MSFTCPLINFLFSVDSFPGIQSDELIAGVHISLPSIAPPTANNGALPPYTELRHPLPIFRRFLPAALLPLRAAQHAEQRAGALLPPAAAATTTRTAATSRDVQHVPARLHTSLVLVVCHGGAQHVPAPRTIRVPASASTPIERIHELGGSDQHEREHAALPRHDGGLAGVVPPPGVRTVHRVGMHMIWLRASRPI